MPRALDGIRVLDLCIILAGPTCGRTLAEHGADVIKIDPEHRLPGLTPWLDVGRGKRSICLNIAEDAGLKAFYRLADTADVVLQGFRKGVAERLGIGYDQLSERNPGIVYASINAFGREGSWSTRPGFDQNAQAATGMQLRNGGIGGEPGTPPYTFNDYGTGVMAAYAVMLALLERERSGRGQQVSTSLAMTASTFSSEYMVDYEGFEPLEISGPHAKGTGPHSRLYETADGWIAVSIKPEDGWGPIIRQGSGEILLPAVDDEEAMERAFAGRTTDEWLSKLDEAGVPAAAHRELDDVLADPYVKSRGLVVSEIHPAFGVVEYAGVAPKMSATPVATGTSPVFGGDTEAVLTELGYGEAEIEAMRADGVIPKPGGIPLR